MKSYDIHPFFRLQPCEFFPKRPFYWQNTLMVSARMFSQAGFSHLIYFCGVNYPKYWVLFRLILYNRIVESSACHYLIYSLISC
jgi:hypothetical protein